jgi:hypothetical protein
VQETVIANLEGDRKGIFAIITESKDGQVMRSETTLQGN